MDCTICGKTALPGALLCAPCKAALKRARYVTVQEDIRRPSVIDVRRRPRLADSAPSPELPDAVPGAAAESAANAQLARRIFGGILILAAVLGGASYFGLHELGARSHDESPAAAAPETDSKPEAVTTARSPQPGAVATPVQATVAAPAEHDAEPAHSMVVKPAGTNAGKRPMLKSGASFATANGDPPEAVPMPEPARPAPAPPPPPPPIPDRWQSMRDAIAQCDRENLFNGIICGQRARIQYCEGYWGKVPQCPGPTANPEH